MELDAFLARVQAECTAAGVTVVISLNNRVFYEGMACNGFFEPTYPVATGLERVVSGDKLPPDQDRGALTPLLAAARGSKSVEDFLSLLAHEYCHMRQFVEGSPYWPAADELLVWEQWLGGKDFEPALLERVWRRVVLVEVDCETRVLAMARELNLQLDRTAYAKRANSYLFFYSWALRNRRFYDKAPYEIADIVDRMPDTLLPHETYVGSELAHSFVPLFEVCGTGHG